jgi:hypothetical protein
MSWFSRVSPALPFKSIFFRHYPFGALQLFRSCHRLLAPRPRAHAPYQHITFQSLPPAGSNLKQLPPSSPPSCFILCFNSFNFICAQSMSSDDADFVGPPDCSLLQTPCRVTCNGEAVPVCPHAQISDTAPALVSEEKSKNCRVAPAPYVPNKKWKVVLQNKESAISISMRAIGWKRAASKCCSGIYVFHVL